MASKQTLIDEALQAQRSVSQPKGRSARDLLSTYMGHLSHIPLFTAEEELQKAKHLEVLDLEVWRMILAQPAAVEFLCTAWEEEHQDVLDDMQRLCQSNKRSIKRCDDKALPMSKSRLAAIDNLLVKIRRADFDKVRQDQVVLHLEDCAKPAFAKNNPTAMRVTSKALKSIKDARSMATRARNNFVRANLRLVVSVARGFLRYKVPFIDLIQEGNVGLVKAVHRFDYRRGFRFSTYAHWWIRQSVERAIINKGSEVRLPVHVIEARRRYARAKSALRQELGKAASHGQIAKRMGVTVEKVEEIVAGLRQTTVSLESHVGGDESRRLVDILEDTQHEAIDITVMRQSTHHRVKEVMQLLSPIEKDIINRRFGLGDQERDQTLDEIGKIYKLSRERVRQIQAQGLVKMRRMCERRDISPVA